MNETGRVLPATMATAICTSQLLLSYRGVTTPSHLLTSFDNRFTRVSAFRRSRERDRFHPKATLLARKPIDRKPPPRANERRSNQPWLRSRTRARLQAPRPDKNRRDCINSSSIRRMGMSHQISPAGPVQEEGKRKECWTEDMETGRRGKSRLLNYFPEG